MQTRLLYVVDDDKPFRESLVFYLVAEGHTVIHTGSGQEFLSSLGTYAPGCVLLDLRMPDIDGLEVLSQLRSVSKSFPVIMMTGHGDVVSAVRAMKMGATDFIEKPFDEAMLIEMLAKAEAELESNTVPKQRQECARLLVARLTNRESDVLRGLLEGLPNKVLAYRLGLSVRTVEMHRASMMERLDAKSLSDALRIAYLAGL